MSDVFWAGNVSGNVQVVSIFNNPAGKEGGNEPLSNLYGNLNRVYLDTRLSYLNILVKQDFVQTYPYIEPYATSDNVKGKIPTEYPRQGQNYYSLYSHNLGYVPAAMLIDYDTREVIGSSMFVQNSTNDAFRTATLVMDNVRVYLRENYFVRRQALNSLTRRYTLLIFKDSAETV